MNCPDCDLPMAEEKHFGITLDRCEACDGLWFDADEVRLYLQSHPETAAEQAKHQIRLARGNAGVGRTCPNCEEEALLTGDAEGLTFQHCSSCDGTFFTHAELARVIAHGKPGEPPPQPRTWQGDVLDFAGSTALHVLEFVVEVVTFH